MFRVGELASHPGDGLGLLERSGLGAASVGLALAALTHAMTPTMPVIIMSGSFNKVGALEHEGIDLVPKAEIPRALKEAVERAVERLGSLAVS